MKKFTPDEVAVLYIGLTFVWDRATKRQFEISELPEAAEIMKKLKAVTETDASGNLIFSDSELEFTSAQNVLLTKLVGENRWEASNAEIVLSTLEKIK